MDRQPRQVPRRTALGLFAGAAATATWGTAAWESSGAAAAPPAGPAAVPPGEPAGVRLRDNGTEVVLENTMLSVTVRKATAEITRLVLAGSTQGNQDVNLVSGPNGHGYTTFDYHIGTTRFSKGMSAAAYRIVAQTPDRVEIAMTVDDPANLPFAVETHLALEKDLPGLYGYLIFRYPAAMPDGLTIQQLRYAVAADDPSFTYFVVDDRRGVQQRPTIADTQHWTTLQDTTFALPDGSIYSKYQNITDLEGDSQVFMISNGRVGLSMIQASKEAFAGGPTKQELTAHDYFDGEILLWHPFTSHYGSPQIRPEKGWEKIYGPFLLRVDEEAGSADPAANVWQLWGRAKAAARREQDRWPYHWVSDPLYAAGDRSTVGGRLTIVDKTAGGAVSPERAWVVLSAPGQDWQYENTGYTYSARADAKGRFTVPAVRPGTYTLTAFVTGVLGEYKQDNVVVGAGRRTSVGTLVWKPVHHGRTLWQIGTPDRSTAGFHVYGGPDGFRKHLTWLEYPYEFPDGVDFRVGVDDPAQQWNYFHPAYRTPGTDTQLSRRGTTPDRSLTTWRIRFTVRRRLAGTATLDIALASSVFGTLRIALNGTQLASFDPLPGPPGDNASYRLSYRSMYRQLAPIVFPAGLLVAGENVITLSPVRAPKAPLTQAGTVDDWMEPMAGVMYDMIRLQVDERLS